MRPLLLVLMVALAGCSSPLASLGGDGDGPGGDGTGDDNTGGNPRGGGDGPSGHGTIEGFVRDAEGAIAGATVRVQGTGLVATSATDGSFVLQDVPTGRQVVRAQHEDRNGSTALDVLPDTVHTVFVDLGVDVVSPPEPGLPGTPSGFVCPEGNVTEPHRTFGAADGMVWAALKTGFRAVFLWEEGELEYRIGQGATQSASGGLLVLDGLTPGKTVCFRSGGAWHAMELANAMNAHDGVYTANFLILVNEGTDAGLLEKGVQRFAELTWDASDGNIRIGTVIAVFDDFGNQDEALQPCWNANPGVHFPVFEAVLCDRMFDIIFSHNVNPAAAGATYMDGIQRPDTPLWMNAVHQAGLASFLFTDESQVREVGSVLTHEVGHYMLGAQDLYPSAGIVSTDCYDGSTGISIMSSSRDATEFDSANTPCKNASSAYEPTWGRMMERFPLIEERGGPPLVGPDGDGGAFSYHAVTVGL